MSASFSGTVAIAAKIVWAQSPTKAVRATRAAAGLLATWQSTAWLGAEAGLFKKHNIVVSSKFKHSGIALPRLAGLDRAGMPLGLGGTAR